MITLGELIEHKGGRITMGETQRALDHLFTGLEALHRIGAADGALGLDRVHVDPRGSLLIEPLFQYQGIGWILKNSVNQRDYPVMQGVFIVITISVIFANLMADLLYSRLDPRIRVGGGQSK